MSPAIPDGWHEQADWENEHQHAEGYQAGYTAGWAAAEQAIADEIAKATGVALPDRTSVIRWLVDGIGRIPRPPEQDHPGGPVAWDAPS